MPVQMPPTAGQVAKLRTLTPFIHQRKLRLHVGASLPCSRQSGCVRLQASASRPASSMGIWSA